MIRLSHTTSWFRFFLRIILPAILTIVLFIVALYAIIIPHYENTIMDRKRELIHELTNTACSVLAKYQKEEADSLLTRTEAQSEAISKIRYLRYGEENKDYFWITDMYPNMVMHPYRSDLEGQSLRDFTDPHGKRLFVEFVHIVRESGEGYTDYMWQWKDDSTRIVPKLSFVLEFKPWGWIIGTGIYIEDVNAEITRLEGRIIRISLLITAVIFLLLAFLMRQSMRLERNRQRAEKELKDSKERYKALVEASTEGSLLLFEDYIYANRTIQELLGYDEDEISRMNIGEIVIDGNLFGAGSGFHENLEKYDKAVRAESLLRRKDGSKFDVLLDISRTAIAGKDAVIIITREPSYGAPGLLPIEETRQQFSHITDSLQIGFFRTTLARRSYFLDANPAAMQILGFKTKTEMMGANIEELFADADERKRIVKELITTGYVKKRVIRIIRRDMNKVYILVSLTVVHEPGNDRRFCDGLVEDVTLQTTSGYAHDALTEELRSSRMLMNRSVESFAIEPVWVNTNTTVSRAAGLLSAHNRGAALVLDAGGDCLGIVTDEDFRSRVTAAGISGNTPVFEVMTSPVFSVSEKALLWEALMLMDENKVSCLAVKNTHGKVQKLICRDRITSEYLETGEASLLQNIGVATNDGQLAFFHAKLQLMVAALSDAGLNVQALTRIISNVSEAIIVRVNELAQEELGLPPVPYAFISLGSVGREEQTLATDQDNAIIYEDGPPERIRELQTYFLNLGEYICNKLNAVGYAYCKGGIMARNPKFCQPLSVWKSYFSQWVATNEPKDLLDVNIFFDFRNSFGDSRLTDALRQHLQSITEHNNVFFFHLAMNTLSIKPSLGIFGNIIRDGKETHPDTFDIKRAIMPLTGFARIYALKNGIFECNTLTRTEGFFEQGVILRSEFEKFVQMYEYLMHIRFRHQVKQLREHKTPDNFVNPEILTELDQAIIKKIFSMIGTLQTRLSYDFKGSSV